MSIDLPTAINIGSTVLIVGILVLGIYRALEMRRAFVGGIYRSRATWSIFLMLVIIVNALNNFVGNTTSFPSSGVLYLIGVVYANIVFFGLYIIIFAYADRSVLVAIETDFFHRQTLSWPRVRWPVAMAIVALAVILGIGGAVLTPAEQSSFLGTLINGLFFPVFAGALAYLTAALIVGARRSADRTLRRSILLLGLALSTLVLSIVVTSFLDSGTLPYVIVNQGTGIVGIYLLYRSVMALSPLGRVQKEVSTSFTQVPLVGAPT
ncbi:MAG: hypothetical protein OK452_11570 [Thaumarchaeota archaeon]|nr:hypothetical protein [Nitrososphaerota archaeon]